jgi:hypothetical protein
MGLTQLQSLPKIMTIKTTQSIEVRLAITADDYLLMYKGIARSISAVAVDGRRVSFPANIMQRFVTRDGIYGLFLIRFSAAGRFLDVVRLD